MSEPRASVLETPIDAPDKTEHHLAGWTLIKAVIALNAANGISFVDLLSITTVIPDIAVEFNAANSIAWAATAQLIGAAIGQCILGYLSDIYSRRFMLKVAILILAISAMMCGLSSYSHRVALLFIFRGLCGVATGSISNLVNIAQNDFLPVERRAKYQGIQGVSVAVGSIAGMFAGSAFSSIVHRWELLYYMEAGLALATFALIHFFVPANVDRREKRDGWAVVKSIDIAGIVAGSAFTISGLILISQGSSLKGNTAVTVVLILVTILAFAAFLYLGFSDRGVRPVIPFDLFRNRTIVTILVQNILLGAAYYTLIYFLPLNLQVVRQVTAIHAAALIAPYMVMHGIWTTASGFVISFLQHRGRSSYSYVLTFGFGVWTLAMALMAFESSMNLVNLGAILILEVLVGLGTGSVFQNSIIAIRAQVTAKQNAVAVSTRNVLRFFGGALGTAISSSIMQNRLKALLSAHLEDISDTAFARVPVALAPADEVVVQEAYAGAIALVFYVAAAMVGVCFILCPLIKDAKVGREDHADIEGGAVTAGK